MKVNLWEDHPMPDHCNRCYIDTQTEIAFDRGEADDPTFVLAIRLPEGVEINQVGVAVLSDEAARILATRILSWVGE